MDFNIIQILAPILVILLTQGVKKISAIPINAGQKKKLMATAGVLSFVVSIISAFANGSLDSFVTPELVNVGVNTVLTFILSQVGYKGVVAPIGAKLRK